MPMGVEPPATADSEIEQSACPRSMPSRARIDHDSGTRGADDIFRPY